MGEGNVKTRFVKSEIETTAGASKQNHDDAVVK